MSAMSRLYIVLEAFFDTGLAEAHLGGNVVLPRPRKRVDPKPASSWLPRAVMLPGNQHHHNVASHIDSKDYFPAASTKCRLVEESSVATAAHQTEAINACGSLHSAMPGCLTIVALQRAAQEQGLGFGRAAGCEVRATVGRQVGGHAIHHSILGADTLVTQAILPSRTSSVGPGAAEGVSNNHLRMPRPSRPSGGPAWGAHLYGMYIELD